ncbi:Predicted oxidoreductase [Thermomonospora echinospora]|uniref:Predicted oxidoreductase n=1 Tax=Thermomonospora echinospora TaxID=1992 RepID=A0A1H6EAB7_9ACTN|nr:Predicted oxidoreductase [Thermomonospora echinospora]
MIGHGATRRIGDLEVSAIGLGAMTLTQVPGYDAERGVRTVHAALDAGVTLIDTADVYGPAGGDYGVNELAVAEALRRYPGSTERVVVATKGGHVRFFDTDTWSIDGRPEYLRRACEASLRRLGLETLPLYLHHRPDPKIPYAESMGGLKELYDKGLVQRVGISNVSVEQVRLAHEILGPALVAVENEYSPRARDGEPVIELCEDLGLAFLSWGPLGGMRGAKDLGSAFGAFGDVAAARGVSPQRIALAWQMHRSPAIIPIPGASRPESILDSLAATDLDLTPEELQRLDRTPRSA